MTESAASSAVEATVVVPSYRGASTLPRLLDSLAAQRPGGPSFEVVVVVDGEDDGSVALLGREDRIDVRPIVFPDNRGRVAALNAGYDAARGRVLIRCDDDLAVPSTFVAAHVQAHEGGTVGAIGLTRDVHAESAFARAYGRDASGRSYTAAASRGAEGRWRHWAANCSVSRETWEQVGPYDVRYRAYGWEDIDYGYRLFARGIELVVVEGAEAEHHGPARTAAARAMKAYEAGAARTVFESIHPRALPQGGVRGGLWDRTVEIVARTLRSRSAVQISAGVVDRILPAVPVVVGRKLVALMVEGAAMAGQNVRRSPSGRDGSRPAPRIAIAHDYITQRGGAERVVLSLCRAFPDATVHTLFYEPDQTYPEFRDRDIRVSPLNRIGAFRRDPRKALPFLALFASRMRIDADVVIASSSGWAHAFPTSGKRIVYCHSPARWLYLAEDYLGDAGRLDPKRLALAVLGPALRRWDRRAAHGADVYLGNSTVVRQRIKDVYGIDAQTLFPPFSPDVAEGPQVEIEPEISAWAEGPGYFLVVSRLQPYKNVDAVIDAFRSMPGKRLLVIGKGPEGERLRAMAPENVRLVEGLTDSQMRWAYGHAQALVCASYEDFGLTPLEAGAHGVPTIALRAGGYLDTIEEGVNGTYFDEATPLCIRSAVQEAPMPEDREDIRAHVAGFGEDRFIGAIRGRVDDLLIDTRRVDSQ